MINKEDSKNLINKPKRPVLLSVLCILTFIGSGLGSLSFLVTYLSFDIAQELFQEMKDIVPGIEYVAKAGKNLFLTGSILYFFSLLGASLMWQLRKAGFHFYVASQILLVILPLVYISGYGISFLDVLLSLVFIFLYATFLKIMK